MTSVAAIVLGAPAGAVSGGWDLFALPLLAGLGGVVLVLAVLWAFVLGGRPVRLLAAFALFFLAYQTGLVGLGRWWPELPRGVLSLCLGLSVFWGGWYARSIFGMDDRGARWAIVFGAVMVLGLVAAGVGLIDFLWGDVLGQVTGIGLGVGAALVSALIGRRPGAYLTAAAWSFFAVGLILHLLLGLDLAPDHGLIRRADLLGFILALSLFTAAAVHGFPPRRPREVIQGPESNDLQDRLNSMQRAVDDLERSEKRLRRIIDNAPDLIWQCDPQGVIEYAGPAWDDVLGLGPAQVVGRRPASFIHAQDRLRFGSDWTAWRAGDRGFFGEYRLESSLEAEPVWIEIKGAPASLPALGGFVFVLRDITTRKRAEEAGQSAPAGPALNQSEPEPVPPVVEQPPGRYHRAFFEHLFEYSPDAIVITEPDGSIDLVNACFKRLSGYTQEEAKGKNLSELLDNPAHRRLLCRAAREETVTDEVSIRRRDGRRIETAVTLASISIDLIQIGLLVIYRDVTSLKQTQADLQRDKTRFKNLVENSPLGVALIRADGRADYLNQAFTRMLGYRLEDMTTGQDFFVRAFPDPAYRARVMKAWLEGLERFDPGLTRPLKCAVTCADKSTRIVEFRPMILADGGSVVTVEDVTDQELTVRALRRSERRLRSVFENAASGLAVINLDHRFERVNHLLAEMLGFETQELVGQSVLNLTHPEDKDACQAGIEAVIKSPGGTDRQEIRYFTHSGAAIWVDQAIRGLLSDQGELEGLVFIASDITPRKELEQKLHHLATTDPLTGINNRRQQLRLTEKEILRARRYGQPLSLLVLDVDDFKAVNDHYGHAAGDRILKDVASVAVEQLRDSDFLGRIGGEEFCATLVHSDLGQAVITAERLRRAFEKHPFKPDGETVQVTVSIGAAQFDPDSDDMTSLVNRADKAMYRAKSQGKNRVSGLRTDESVVESA
jgi:diguanylate cyclase (GGDEF)-like protein/PAS domain S-box-containing protein